MLRTLFAMADGRSQGVVMAQDLLMFVRHHKQVDEPLARPAPYLGAHGSTVAPKHQLEPMTKLCGVLAHSLALQSAFSRSVILVSLIPWVPKCGRRSGFV